MNKKVIAAAISAAVVAAPAAFAESVLYGKFHTSIDMVDQKADDSKIVDNTQVRSRSSRIGVKGSEDLGDGLKAIYQFETSIVSDGGNQQNVGNGFGSQRNTFIGLASGFGTFLVGRHDTPAKIAFYGTGNEMLGDSIIDLNPGSGSVVGVFSELRANNAIAYISPTFAGFTFLGAIVPGEEPKTDSGNESDGWSDHYSLGLTFKGFGGLKAGGSYEVLDNQAAGVDPGDENTDRKTWQIGASYTFAEAFTLGAQYQDSDNFFFEDGVDYTAWGIVGKAKFGNNAISAVYTDAEAERDFDKADKDGWGIAAEHNFSKRTKIYAAYATADGRIRVEDLRENRVPFDDDRFSLGMIHNF